MGARGGVGYKSMRSPSWKVKNSPPLYGGLLCYLFTICRDLFSRFGGIIRRLEVFLLLFFPWGAFLLRFPPCGGHFIFIFQVGGVFFLSLWKPTPFTKTSEGALQERPQDLGGGGQEIFFSDFEICMSRSDMLRMAKPCA